MILAIEMVRDKSTRMPYPWQERRGLRIHRHALARGVLRGPWRRDLPDAALCHQPGRN